MFKKADIYLYIILIVIGLFTSYYVSSLNTPGTTVKITVDGELYGNYSLDTNNNITIETETNYNVIVIEDGYVYMLDANCPNKICMKHSPINKTGESIVCLPHKVLIEITGGEEYDGISS
ncbi:MAG TPA: NusG domain II-containing protein [Anaerovoracaceae bacterium]|nr:NusG domain II-containing protein [Anaerovoracaceae bacterium]